jgi:ABC-2 type transport system permease protein
MAERGDLRKLLAVIKREFLERVRTRLFVVTTILGPAFLTALTAVPAWLAMNDPALSPADLVVIDATGTRLGDRIGRALADSAPGGVRPVVMHVTPARLAIAESTVTAAVAAGARQGVLVLDSATLAGTRARYAGRNAGSPVDVSDLRDVVRREVLVARVERAGLPADRAAALAGPRLQLATTAVADAGADGTGAGGTLAATVVALLLYVMIVLYGQNVLRSVLEEKTTRVAEVVLASVRPEVLMTGKVLGVGAVGLLQQLVWFGGALAIGSHLLPWIQSDLPGTAGRAAGAAAATAAFAVPAFDAAVLGSALLFFLLGYTLYATLFAAAGAAVSSDQEAQQAALPVMLPLIASAIFTETMLQHPESAVARFIAWCPLTAPVMMPMRMALVPVSTGEFVAVAAGVTLACVLALRAAARIYRVGMLMYGKRPSLLELGRWMIAAP